MCSQLPRPFLPVLPMTAGTQRLVQAGLDPAVQSGTMGAHVNASRSLGLYEPRTGGNPVTASHNGTGHLAGTTGASRRGGAVDHRRTGLPGKGWPDVLDMVHEHATAAPQRAAIRGSKATLGYSELDRFAQSVGYSLRRRGIVPGDRVVLYLPNSVEWVITALGCLWAGAAFVPLSVEDPPARAARAIDDCKPKLVIAAGHEPPATGVPCASASELAAGPALEPAHVAEPADLAYIIYTSGTTGAPKGVCISRKAFGWSVREIAHLIGLSQHSRSLAVSAFHFDGSFATVFPTLVAGGLLVVAQREELLFLRPFFDTVLSESITHTSCSPSYLRLLLGSRQFHRLSSSDLVTMGLGGEECQPADVAKLWQVLPDLRVLNYYGPTECAIAVTNYTVSAEDVATGRIPLGRPHDGCQMVVVDEDGRTGDEPGCAGELYIGGEQLMSGYFGDPELSAQVLRNDIVAGQPMYKTGDLAEIDDRGRFHYKGRADDIVKRKGVRISLSEMSRSLRRAPGIASAHCALYDKKGEVAIVAFVVAEPGTNPTAPALLERASREMPTNMLPDTVHFVGELPVTSSGKVDWRRLLAEGGYEAWR